MTQEKTIHSPSSTNSITRYERFQELRRFFFELRVVPNTLLCKATIPSIPILLSIESSAKIIWSKFSCANKSSNMK
jgi:hypothetical protein